MKLLAISLLCVICLASSYDLYDELLKKIHEDPVNAFLVHPFKKPKTTRSNYDDSLPRDVVVHSYDLQIEPFFAFKGFKFNPRLLNTFNGQVSIQFSVLKPRTKLELASRVTLTSSSLALGRRLIKIAKPNPHGNHHLILNAEEQLKPGLNYTLGFKFEGEIAIANQDGLFHVDYVDQKGENNSLIGTMFETIAARKVFPSFDDPFFKSIFKLALIHPKDAKVYSNEQIDSQQYFDEQRSLTRFKPTPRMSTYLLAWAVGDFVESNSTSSRGVLNRAIAVNNFTGLIEGAALMGAQCVDAMENLVKVKYPLKKLDHIDVVSYGATGMENFGMIIYRDIVPHQFGQTIAESAYRRRLICHETSHQWFGDLVTADRWGWEFLHEGFASFFETQTLEQNEEFTLVSKTAEFSKTAVAILFYQEATHPIIDNRTHFDMITYQVGGSFLNCIRHVLGDKVFYKGLNIYQTENAFKNAGLDTLLQSWVKARNGDEICLGLTFTEFAKDYFLRVGVPTVNIHLDKEESKLVFSQTKKNGTTWSVPIFLLNIETNKEDIIWLLKDGSVCYPQGFNPHNHQQYIFNNEGKGFATFEIEKSFFNNAIESDKFAEFSIMNQYALLSYATGKRMKSYEELGDIIFNVVKKTKGNVLYVLLYGVNKGYKHYKKLFTIVSDNFDYNPTPEKRILGEVFLPIAVQLNIPSAVNKTTELFEQFKEDCALGKDVVDCPRIPPEWRRAVYGQGKKSVEGRRFLEEYQRRVETHPLAQRMKSERFRLSTL